MDIASQFEPFLKQYDQLVQNADRAFEQIQSGFPDCVTCKPTCSDCCYALFDLTLVEAMAIRLRFQQQCPPNQRDALLDKCNQADRTIYKIKRKAYKRIEAGEDAKTILAALSEERVRCPMLNDAGYCDIYPIRPITCRLYGIPTFDGEKSHTCGLSRFERGQSYPTVKLDRIHQKLLDISADFVRQIHSRHRKMGDMLVPLSMAILTVYDDEFLGLRDEVPSQKGEEHHGS
jgi:Fe-S-cluster containining protein